MPISKLNAQILEAALIGFEEEKRRIDVQIAAIRQMLAGDGTEPQPKGAPPAKRKRKLSVAGRAAIVAALKKRWAAKKAAKVAKPVVRQKTTPKAAR